MSLRSCGSGKPRRSCSKLAAYCPLQNMSCTRHDHREPGRSHLSPGKHHTGPEGSCHFPVQGWGLLSAVTRGQAPPAHCSCWLRAGPFPGPWALLQATVWLQPQVGQQPKPCTARWAGNEEHCLLQELLSAAVPSLHCGLLCSCLLQTGICLAKPALAVQHQAPPQTVLSLAAPGTPSDRQDSAYPLH